MLEFIKNVVLIYGAFSLGLAVIFLVIMLFTKNEPSEVDYYED